jgi:chromosome segregation ATPase
LQQYTEIQLARIRGEHEALVNRIYHSEQTMILGCQELSRKEELLAQQSRVLQQQAGELSQRERALAGQLEQWSKVQGELADLCQARVRTEEETEQQRALLDTLRGEAMALQKSREATQAELEAMARALDEQREARAKEQALTRTHQAQMDKRLRDLDRAEQAVQRRVAELDELEARLREEFEGQERQLAEQRRDITALYARLRQRAQEGSGAPGDGIAADLQG